MAIEEDDKMAKGPMTNGTRRWPCAVCVSEMVEVGGIEPPSVERSHIELGDSYPLLVRQGDRAMLAYR